MKSNTCEVKVNSNNNTDNNTSKCPVCGDSATKTCSGCHLVVYCSPEHQKKHWKEHKRSCRLFIIQKNETMGRFVVAARDISPGTIIMSEKPLAYGPKQNTKPLCLGCYKLLSDARFKCSKCHFPMCSQACEKVPAHAENECKIFQRSDAPLKITDFDKWNPAYECILTIRSLLLRSQNPKSWAALNEMECHNDIRRSMKELWHRNQVNTVQFLRERYKMKDEFDEETIHRVLGYADVNSFELRTSGTEICGLYPNIYIMAHDCLSNTHHSITDDFRMIVRAVVPIKKGELITTVYTHTLDGTLERRQYIKESKFFDCICKRCSDPTELGTNFSTIKCTDCPEGYRLPDNSLDPLSKWTCDRCKVACHVSKVQTLISQIKEEMDEIKVGDNIIPKLEALMAKHSGKTVHPNHYLMMNICHSLSEFYGRTAGFLIDSLSVEHLQRKEMHCRHLLSVLDVLEAGLTRIRGLTLYELHAALYFTAKSEFQRGVITSEQLKTKLNDVLQLLEDAQEILMFDSPNTPEGIIAKSIAESIQSVELVRKHCCT